jgi:molecular chaperone DnaK
MSGESWVLAIDFGTSFTVAASRIGDRPPEVIELDGERRVPSLIMIDDDGAVMVGKAAENLASTNPGRVLRAPKSRLGEPAPVVLGGRPHAISALVADLLRHVYREAVRYHGSEPEQVRLTHPATWSGPRRQQLLAAAEQAGLPDPVLVPEPVAAAIAYADEGAVPDGGHVLVYDLGGGTFDTAALQASPNGFVVVGRPGGDPRLGGELFDELLANTIGQRLEGDTYERIQLAEDALWQQAAVGLLRESRRVKEALSSHPFAEVLLGLPTGLVQQRIGQTDLYEVIGPYISESVDVMRQTALGAGLEAGDLSSIYLVGGASRTPLVEESVAAAYPDVRISRRGDPKGVVALGATHPLATPTSLAQRSSLDRASTLDRPGPPPPAAPLVVMPLAANAPTVDAPPPPPGVTRFDTTAPTPVTRVDGPPLANTRIDAAVGGTVIDGLGSGPPLPPPAPPPGPSAASPSRTKLIIGAAAAAAVLLVGGIVIASRGGDEQASPPTVTTRPISNGGGAPVTLPLANPIEPGTSPSSSVTQPTPAPTPPPSQQPTTALATVAVTPSPDQLDAALVTLDDLTSGSWTEVPFVPSPGVCGDTAGEGIVGTVITQFKSTQTPVLGIAHRVTAYGAADTAQADYQANIDLIANCGSPTTDFGGVTYTVGAQTKPLTSDIIAGLPCFDAGALIVFAYVNADAAYPLLVETDTVVRCGSNITIVGLAADKAEPPADYIKALGAATLRINNLPGSN